MTIMSSQHLRLVSLKNSKARLQFSETYKNSSVTKFYRLMKQKLTFSQLESDRKKKVWKQVTKELLRVKRWRILHWLSRSPNFHLTKLKTRPNAERAHDSKPEGGHSESLLEQGRSKASAALYKLNTSDSH